MSDILGRNEDLLAAAQEALAHARADDAFKMLEIMHAAVVDMATVCDRCDECEN